MNVELVENDVEYELVELTVRLFPAFRKLDVFQKCPEQFIYHLALCCVERRVYNGQQVIIREGEEGTWMGFILSGVATVEVNRAEGAPGGTGGPPPSTSIPSRRGTTTTTTSGTTTTSTSQPTKTTTSPPPTASKLFVKTLHVGAVFGELAMLGVSNVRMATVTAKQKTQVCVVHRAHLQALLPYFPDAAATLGLMARVRIQDYFSAFPSEGKLPMIQKISVEISIMSTFFTKGCLLFRGS